MVRSYDPTRPVDDAVLTDLLDQASRAPSAGHSQGRDLLVLRGEARERFWDVTTGRAAGPSAGGPPSDGLPAPASPDRWLSGLRTAPVLVLCLSDPDRYVARYAEADKVAARASPGAAGRGSGRDAWPVPYWDVDSGMAAMLLLLGAVDAGLGACFFGVPDHRHHEVRDAFGVPTDRRLVGVVSLGHPAPDRRSPSLRRGRRPFAEIAHEGRFGVPFGAGHVVGVDPDPAARAHGRPLPSIHKCTSRPDGYLSTMSDDKSAAKDLVTTLKDGQNGYTEAADKLTQSNRPEWAQTMTRFAQQRGQFAQEIVDMGHAYGDDVDESGSVVAAAHRGWLSLKDAVTGDDPSGVLDAAVQGEDHSVQAYEEALKKDLSADFRTVVQRQHAEVAAARDEVKGLQTAS